MSNNNQNEASIFQLLHFLNGISQPRFNSFPYTWSASVSTFFIIFMTPSSLFFFRSVFEKDDTAVISLLDVGFNRVSNDEQVMNVEGKNFACIRAEI